MKILAKVAVGIWLIVLGYFGYLGMLGRAWEGDSLAYHIPIARNIVAGKWGNFDNWLEYYPGTGEIILAGFMKLGIPLNLYNVVGWIVLFWVVREFGEVWGIGKDGATILAAAAGLLPSVVRLIPTQTVDIWMAVWGLFALRECLMFNVQCSIKSWIKFGVFLGLLIGTKYSGLGFAAVFLAAAVWKYKSKNFLVAVLVMILVGGGWYLRNYLEMGHALYPVGAANFRMLERRVWMIPVYHPAKFAEALFSEYLLWPVLGIVLIAHNFKFLIFNFKSIFKSKFLNLKTSTLLFLAAGNFGVYLFIPAGVENVLSDSRYIYLVMIPLMLACFLWAKEHKREEELGILALLMMVVEFTQLDFHPKLFAVLMAIWILGNWRRR
ncbi:MAG: hypothetical protein G01um101416_260 [Microgenomates group bacterium Gr01-1014_16]|nr:MAG: hypothetical protein G01um101416_260 [Microgenomates group bacterium Gr01-1014_16]